MLSLLTQRMMPRSQNLFLFFEDYEMQNIIDTKLMKLYMNRCVIEEGYFDIRGVYQLQFVEDRLFTQFHSLYGYSDKRRDKKEDADRKIFVEALKKASSIENDFTDNHFIIGSSYYRKTTSFVSRIPPFFNRFHLIGFPTVGDLPTKLESWLASAMMLYGIQNIYITVLSGHRYNLITKDMVNCVYAGDYSIPMHINSPNGFSPDFPVNDDFELAIKLLRNGRRLQQNMLLHLHQMLNLNQLKLREERNKPFLKSCAGYRFNTKVRFKLYS